MDPDELARLIPLGILELRGIIEGSGFRWRLAGIELWRGLDCLGTVSADALRHLIEHHLATAALQAAIALDLAGPRAHPPRMPPAPLPSRIALQAEARAARRALRRSRRRT